MNATDSNTRIGTMARVAVRAATFAVAVTFALLVSTGSASASPIPLQLPWPTGQTHQIGGGYSYNCGDHTGRDYYAIDFNLNYVTVSAVADGWVHLGNDGTSSYGMFIVIDHGGGVISLYGHLSKYLVTDGQHVTQGQAIAISGSTGNSTGGHLHFVMRSGVPQPVTAAAQYQGSALLPEPMSGYSGFGSYGYCHGVVSPAYTSSPPVYTVPSGWTTVVNRNSGKCVDARGGSTVYGTALQQYSCNGSNAQQYIFQPTDSGFYRVSNRNNSTLVWDVTGASTAVGAKLELWGWNGGWNQQWKPVSEGNGYFHFVARNSGQCLDTPGAQTADGLQLQQYPCNGSPAQSFRFAAPPSNNFGPFKVTASPTLNIRSAPSTAAGVVGTFSYGTYIYVACQTSGSSVGGSTVWDRIGSNSPYAGQYVADYWVYTGYTGFDPSIPRC